MEIKLKINKNQQLAYIPKCLFQILSTDVKAVPNRAAVLLFSEKTSIDEALTSLNIIKSDLLHAKKLQQINCSGQLRQEILPEQSTKPHKNRRSMEVTS
jgi:hypothetical protein